MDPKELLKAIREHVAQLGSFLRNGEDMSVSDSLIELAREVASMHEWLCKGRFKPEGLNIDVTVWPDAVRRAHSIISRADRGYEPSITTARKFATAVRKLI